MNEIKPNDLGNEEWREYDFGGRVYRIVSVGGRKL